MAVRRGAGSVFQLNSGADPGAGTWAALPQVRNLRMSQQSGEQEITTLNSTAKEFLRDLPDYGRATATIYYDPSIATQNEISGLNSLFATGENRAYRFLPNGASKWETFVAFVMSDDKSFDPNQPMERQIEFRITGPVTYVAV